MSNTKECIYTLLNQKQYTGICVEVGTWMGDFAEAY